jgi:hypothetical protein
MTSTDTFTYDGGTMPHYGLLWRGHTAYTGSRTMQIAGHGGVRMFTAGAERLTILNNGNVGIGTTSPGIVLDVGSSLSNPQIGRDYAVGSVHDTDKRDSIYFGRWDGTGRDFLGMKCRVDTHSNLGYGSYSNQSKIEFYTWGNNYASSREVMCIRGDGKVGIGINPSYGKLHINGNGGGAWTNYYYFNGGGGLSHSTNWALANTSLYVTGGIVAGDYVAASDERIKKDIVDADDSECLEALRLLKPKRYRYKDELDRGEGTVWGFIAQEVRETLPHSTKLLKSVVPNIYEMGNVSSSNVITFTNFNTADLESNATTFIRTMGADGAEHGIHLEEVIDEHTIRVKEDLTDWIGSVDETGNIIAGTQLFVYGQEVDNFVFLKKDAVWTTATAALQEVDRQLQAEKTKTATLETQVASLLERVTALENA